MDSGKKLKQSLFVALFGLSCAVLALVGIYFYMSYRIDTSGIEHIKNVQVGPGQFNDPSGDVKVESAADIGYIIKGPYRIVIKYGNQTIEMNKRCFKSEEYKTALASIGIKVLTHYNEDDDTVLYKVTYWGTEVDEYVIAD